jgi:hypothetical protein
MFQDPIKLARFQNSSAEFSLRNTVLSKSTILVRQVNFTPISKGTLYDESTQELNQINYDFDAHPIGRKRTIYTEPS